MSVGSGPVSFFWIRSALLGKSDFADANPPASDNGDKMLRKSAHRVVSMIRLARNLRVIDRRAIYKFWEVDLIKRFLKQFEVDCVFDVGANYGQYASMLRDKVGFDGLIVSFEPLPEAAEHLRKISKKDKNWIVVEMAVSDQVGTADFNVTKGNQFSSLQTPINGPAGNFGGQHVVEKTIAVRTTTLDETYREISSKFRFNRPFLKMDTQGGDVRIVRASPNAARKFVGLQSEISFVAIYEGQENYRRSIELYEELGFRMVGFLQNNAGHFPVMLETDCLMANSAL